MITSGEDLVKTLDVRMSGDDNRAAHLAGSVAENLTDGEYILSHLPFLVIFIRIDEWEPNLGIKLIDLTNNFELHLSNGRRIYFHQAQIKSAIQQHDKYRIVLLSDKGFSTFEVELG